MDPPPEPTAAASLRDVTVVVVSYNSAAVLPACLGSIPPEVRLVVVDNASRDGSADLAARLAPGARLIRAQVNLGFGRAANLGFAEAGTRFGLLLNADTFCHPGMVEALLDAAWRYPEAGLLEPATSTPDGRLQFGRTALFDRRHRRRTLAAPEGDCCAAYVGAAATFFPLEAFRSIGGFDPDLFLYFEDDDLCLRMRRAGRPLLHVSAARLGHIAGRSSAPSARLDWWKDWHMGWSRLHVERKHRGRIAALLHGTVQIAWLSVKLAFRWGHPRRKRWAARIAGMAGHLMGRRAVEVGMPDQPAPASAPG